MARPVKTTPKAVPTAVSLYPDERAALRELGGSRFVRQAIELGRRGLLTLPDHPPKTRRKAT